MRHRTARTVVAVSATIVALALVAAGLIVGSEFRVDQSFGPRRTRTFLILALDPEHLIAVLFGVAGVVGAIAILLFASLLARGRARIAVGSLSAIVLTAGLLISGGLTFVSGAYYTELRGDTGGRDLVAMESGFSRFLFERRGSELDLVGTLEADDIDAPFRFGEYRVVNSGERTSIMWASVHGGRYDRQIVVDDGSVLRARDGNLAAPARE